MASMQLQKTAMLKETYETVKAMLHGKPQKRIAGNTTIIDRGSSVALQYHWTDVVTWNENGTIILSSGGYGTLTTKERLNHALNGIARIVQKDYAWYVDFNGHRYHFHSGMVINPTTQTITHNGIALLPIA